MTRYILQHVGERTFSSIVVKNNQWFRLNGAESSASATTLNDYTNIYCFIGCFVHVSPVY